MKDILTCCLAWLRQGLLAGQCLDVGLHVVGVDVDDHYGHLHQSKPPPPNLSLPHFRSLVVVAPTGGSVAVSSPRSGS